jgi:hypothetical protein
MKKLYPPPFVHPDLRIDRRPAKTPRPQGKR